MSRPREPFTTEQITVILSAIMLGAFLWFNLFCLVMERTGV